MTIKDCIVRAAVTWERARAEKVEPSTYRDLGSQEDELAVAVRSYVASLIEADAPLEVPEGNS